MLSFLRLHLSATNWHLPVNDKLTLANSICQSLSKASAYNAGDPGSMPASGRSPGEGNGNPLQYSCLENPMGRGAYSGLQSMGSQRVGHNWATSLHFTSNNNNEGICHLPLQRLNPVLLQLLTFNTLWGSSGWSDAFCAPGNLVEQVFRYLDVFRKDFKISVLASPHI